jgi:hypothetical protein
MKEYGEVEVYLVPSFFTSALNGVQWSASRPGYFRETTSGTHCIGGWVDPERIWTRWSREKYIAGAVNGTLLVQPIVIPAELLKLLYYYTKDINSYL